MISRIAIAVVCFACLLQVSLASAQQNQPTAVAPRSDSAIVQMQGDRFRLSVLRAIPGAVQEGKITRADGLRLRVAMFSPAFAKQAKELALIQMAASGSENVPFTETGEINEAAINWEGLGEFLKVFLPLLLEFLKAIGIGG